MKRLRKSSRVAVDMEADSFHHYFEKVCLIQLATGGKIYLVDPLAGLDLSEFLEVLASKKLIFHDGGYDLRMMRSSFGFRPQNQVFDTMLAAQLLGHRSFGLAAILEHYFDVSVVKTHQKANWSKRPLDQRHVDYAGDDVRYLKELTDILKGRLKDIGRREWHKESCRWMIAATGEDKPKPGRDKEWRIKGTRQMERRQLAYVRQLWRWREHEAKRGDVPPFKVLGNQQLLYLALWADRHKGRSLSRGPRLPRNCKGRRYDALRKAIEKVNQMPDSSWPGHLKPARHGSPNPECKKIIEELRIQFRQIAEGLDIEPFLLASRATITVISRCRPTTIDQLEECGPMMKWQAKQLWPIVKEHF